MRATSLRNAIEPESAAPGGLFPDHKRRFSLAASTNLSYWNSLMKSDRPEWRGFECLVKRRKKTEASFAKRRLEQRAELQQKLAAPPERAQVSKRRPGFGKGYKFPVR